MPDSFIRTYTDRVYRYPAICRHKGTVIAFAMDEQRQIHYTVLDLDDPTNASPFDVDHWLVNPRVVRFPDEIAQVGFGLADQTQLPVFRQGSLDPEANELSVVADEVDLFRSTTARFSADTPFQVMSDNQFVYIFRQAIAADHADQVFQRDQNGNLVLDREGNPVPLVNRTLLVDRFVLSGTELQTKREVRFRRSRSRTRPQSRKDSLGATDMEDRPFFEPTQELTFIANLVDGRFTALLVPTAIPDVSRWQIFAYNGISGMIDSYNVERANDGLFNTRGSQASSTEGYAESALEFDGATAHIELDQNLTIADTFTYEAWILPRPTTNPAGEQGRGLITSADDAASSAPSVWIDQNTRVRVGFGDGQEIRSFLSGDILTLNNWNHLAVSFNRRTVQVYVNGILRYRSEQLSDITIPATPIRYIGAPQSSFSGTLDEVRIWDRARDGSQIAADMNQRLIGNEPGLQAYWRLDEGMGDRVYGQTSNVHMGTLRGPTWVTSDAPIGVTSGINRNSFRFAGRSIESGLTALLYYHQENVVSGYDREEKPLKQRARVMLATATRSQDESNAPIAVIDFAVSRTGQLSQVPDNLALRAIDSDADGRLISDINQQLNQISILQQRVRNLQADEVNLSTRIAANELAQNVIVAALSNRTPSNQIPADSELSFLNDQASELLTARVVFEQARIQYDTLTRNLNNARVTVYEHSRFGGRSRSYGINFRQNNESSIGFVGFTELNRQGLNDRITSLQVPPELRVTAYEDANAQGESRIFDTSSANVGREWNDRISSFRISEAPGHAGQRNQARINRDSAAADIQRLENELNLRLNELRAARNSLLAQRRNVISQRNAARRELDALQEFVNSGVAVPMPLLFTDPTGLTTAGGFLSYAWTSDTPRLFDSATGRLALYFRGSDDQFFVTYYDTLTRRAQYELADANENTTVICQARSTEPERSTPIISVRDSDASDTCTVEIGLGDRVIETWNRVPREPRQFARVLNGQARDRIFVGVGQPLIVGGVITDVTIDSGVRRALAAGDTLLFNQTRLTIREAVAFGATTIPVSSDALNLSRAEQPVFLLEYDYALHSQSEEGPVDLSAGSLLVGAVATDDGGAVRSDQTIPNADMPVTTFASRWVAGTPGQTLSFDGDNDFVRATSNDEATLNRFAAPGDLTMEAWVQPIRARGVARIIQQQSSNSSYMLGLESQDLLSALTFNGSRDFILIPNAFELNFRGVITMEAWIRPQATDGIRNILVHGLPDREVYLRINSGTYEAGSFDGATRQEVRASIPPGDLVGPQWVHLAAVYTGSAWVLYRNGDPIGSVLANVGSVVVNTNWAIGAQPAGNTRFFQGDIDEVRIWQRARTAQELQSDRDQRLVGNQAGLVGYWQFSEGVARDYSRSGNNGFIQGNPQPAASPLPGYALVATIGNRAVQSSEIFTGVNWTHLAATFNQSYALQFDGSADFLDAGNNRTLDLTGDLTIEVFLDVASLTEPHGILSKGQLIDGRVDQQVPYMLYLDVTRNAHLVFQDTDQVIHDFRSTRTVGSGFSRIAVTRERMTETQETTSTPGNPTVQVNTFYIITFYIDGNQAGSFEYNGPTIGGNNEALEIGRTFLPNSAQETGFQGILSEVRLWNRALDAASVGSTLRGAEDGLISWWRFEENEGNVTFDSRSTNHAILNGDVTWVINPDPTAARLRIYRDGAGLDAITRSPGDFGPVQPQFALGALANSSPTNFFQGAMEEVRIWNVARTPEQIQDSLFQRVLGNRENLITYYTFDPVPASDEGDSPQQVLLDNSFRGNHLLIENAAFIFSTAPIGDDTPQVRNALAGIRTSFNDTLQSQPSIQEYADLQTDEEGNLSGVFKRCYTLINNGAWQLITGFSVGNLVTEWIGQIQFDPHLIGYIEGAPPVPSENLTSTGVVLGEFEDYNGASSVELVAAESTTYTYAASREEGSDEVFDMTTGFAAGTSLSTEVGGGLLVESSLSTQFQEVDVFIGGRLMYEESRGWIQTATTGRGNTTTQLSSLELRGFVENQDRIAHPAIGRRFVPENFGFALVESETADVFALRLAHNNALVSFQMRPNPDIPRDRNIISFPLNPNYTKQGTLDGRVGLEPDVDYPNALTYSPDSSYFKPIEAFNLEDRFNREQEEIRTYYEQFDAARRGRRENVEADPANGQLLEQLPRFEQRNLVNTYVWTADGGLFAETQNVLDLVQETLGGSYSYNRLAGVSTNLNFVGLTFGFRFQLEALFGGYLNLFVTRSRESESSFEVNVNLENVERDLFIRDENGVIQFDLSDPLRPRPMRLPGKVDAYRFKTFYLEPDTDNYEHFFARVVDPIWLAQSDDPNAAALRSVQNLAEPPACWRMMHRVTFVSRVLPEFDDPTAPPLSPVEQTMRSLDIDSNYELIQRLAPFVTDRITTFAEFARTIRDVIRDQLPELQPHTATIIQQMSLFFGFREGSDRMIEATEVALIPDRNQTVDLAPVVDAGPDQVIGLEGETQLAVADLQGAVADEMPIENLFIAWSQVSGPQGVVFAAADALNTTVSFRQRGRYVLQFTASDGLNIASDLLVIVVNAPPTISAGADQAVGPRDTVQLAGAISDDGLGDPQGSSVRARWSVLSGPGSVTFDPSPLVPNPIVRFSRSGTYLLQFTVETDTFVVSDDVEIDVAARVRDGLQVLYTFDGDNGVVRDVSALGEPLNLVVQNSAAVHQNGALTITEPTILTADGSAERLVTAMQATSETTIEAWIEPASLEQTGLARIVTLSGGPGARNFTLGQNGNTYHLGVRTSTTNPNASNKALAGGTVTPATLTHLVSTRDRTGLTRLYLDGVEVSSRIISGDYSNWDRNFSLALGNEVGVNGRNDRAWDGSFHLVALYNRALRPEEVRQNYEFGANVNLAPVIEAGPDQVIDLPNVATLQGIVTDDRLLADQVEATWSQSSGPAAVIFEPFDALSTTATFARSGRYSLRLAVSDGELLATDELTVIVNQAPTLEVGLPQSIDINNAVRLVGLISNNGLGSPEQGSLRVEWSQVEGPGTASFADANAVETTATFSAYGRYLLRLTADNGRFTASAETEVLVFQTPIIRVEADAIITIPNQAGLRGEVLNDGLGDPAGSISTTWELVSGPADVTFSDVTALQTSVTLPASGSYLLRLTVNNGLLSSSTEVTVIANQAPVVDAGPDQTIVLPDMAELDGTASDDGLPNPPEVLTLTWSQISGPQGVSFGDTSADFTTATFPRHGTYRLQLSASDGLATSSDELTVVVHAAPVIDAGPDQPIQPDETATLRGIISDDGLGDPQQGSISTLWRQVSGPGTTTFGNPQALETTATFTEPGIYVLQLEVSNGFLTTSDNVRIFVATRVNEGLQALYTFSEGEGTTIFDRSGSEPALNLNIPTPQNPNNQPVRWIDGGLQIEQRSLIATAAPASRLTEAAQATNELTIEAWVRPANTTQDGPARIVTLSQNERQRNFTMAQENDQYVVRLRTSETNVNGTTRALQGGSVTTDRVSHLVYTRTANGTAILYLDGAEVDRNTVEGDFSNWDNDYRLALADEFGSNRAWLGTMHLIAIYNRALSAEEVALNYAANRRQLI